MCYREAIIYAQLQCARNFLSPNELEFRGLSGFSTVFMLSAIEPISAQFI